MLCSPGVNTPGTEKISTGWGGIWRERRGVSFLLSFNRSKVRNTTQGCQEVISLAVTADLGLEPWNYKRIPWKSPGRATRQKEKGQEWWAQAVCFSHPGTVLFRNQGPQAFLWSDADNKGGQNLWDASMEAGQLRHRSSLGFIWSRHRKMEGFSKLKYQGIWNNRSSP